METYAQWSHRCLPAQLFGGRTAARANGDPLQQHGLQIVNALLADGDRRLLIELMRLLVRLLVLLLLLLLH
jgi:hypothetical protein